MRIFLGEYFFQMDKHTDIGIKYQHREQMWTTIGFKLCSIILNLHIQIKEEETNKYIASTRGSCKSTGSVAGKNQRTILETTCTGILKSVHFLSSPWVRMIWLAVHGNFSLCLDSLQFEAWKIRNAQLLTVKKCIGHSIGFQYQMHCLALYDLNR